MADMLAFLLFGDQSTDTHGFLADFFRQGNQGLLAKAFLDQVAHALRREIDGLDKLERSKLPKFLTLQQLNERYHAHSYKHPGIDGALLCISQIAHYIEYVAQSTPLNNTRLFCTDPRKATQKSITKMLHSMTAQYLSVSAQGYSPLLPSHQRRPYQLLFQSPSRWC